jgi:hypothetical protein
MKHYVGRLTFLCLLAATVNYVQADDVVVSTETPMTPPAWALLERELLRANTAACKEFFAKYFDERGYFVWESDQASFLS